MEPNSTDTWMVNSTLPSRPQSCMEAHLQRLAQLDESLYNDFYALWIALMLINSVIFLAGLALNSVALHVFCFRTKQRNTSVIYTINLAVTDLLVNLSLPSRILLYYTRGRCVTCSYLHIFSYFVNMYCSILFLTCICVDRYLAIVQVEASRKWRNASVSKCVCVSVWLFAFVVTYSLQSTLFQQTDCISRLLFLTITEFFLPLLIIVVFTLRIMCALTDRRLMQQSRERRRRAVQLLITVLIIFTVCFTPFHIRQVIVYFYPDLPHHAVIYHLTVTLSSLNSCMDPVVYCFVTTNFQATVRHFFQRAVPEVTSGDIVSMQHSSKASGRTANPTTNNMITMARIPASPRKTV